MSGVVWEDLTVELPNPNKKLLNSVTGFAEAGRIMAVMGPSGSGKTTLLDSLAGRLAANVRVTGNILINGKKKRSLNCREVSYVAQEEPFLGTLTVRETLSCSASLRLPSRMTKQEISKVVEETIMVMGLEECADNKLGNWHLRGISNGEKKRLSIGLEILTQPHVLFLDEPTSGLDSASAFYVIQTLSNIAFDGKIVVCSIHQPSSEIFNLFDDLLLLSSGETVYFGEAKMALKFFADAGFPSPTRRNPSDHFLLCINSDFDIVTAALMRSQPSTSASSSSTMGMKTVEIRAALIESYKSSELMIDAKRRIQCLKIKGEQVIESNIRSSSSCWKQLWTLTYRSLLNMTRDIGYYWLRMIFYILIGTGVGTLFFRIGTDSNSISAIGTCVSFIYGFMICLSCGGLPFFIEELKVFYGERSKGHYGEAVFVLSNFLSSFPFILVTSLFVGTIIYFMVQFQLGLTNYAFFLINLFCCLSVIENCVMVVATLMPNVLMGIGVSTGVIILMMMSSPMSRPLSDLPKFFWRYPMSYLSFVTWAVQVQSSQRFGNQVMRNILTNLPPFLGNNTLSCCFHLQGQYKNDMLGLEFYPLVPGDPKVKGEQVIKMLCGISLNHDKWWDLTALMTLLLFHRLIFFLVLKYKKRLKSPLLWLFRQVKSTPLAERFSRCISFKKLEAPHPLSSEEDCMSPNFAI